MGMFHSHKGPQGTIGLSGLQAILTDCHHNPTVAEGLSCAIYEAFQLDKGARMSTREYALTLLALTGPEAGPYRAQVAFHAMDRVIGSGGAISPDDVKAFVTDMAAFSTALFSRLMTQFGKIFDPAVPRGTPPAQWSLAQDTPAHGTPSCGGSCLRDHFPWLSASLQSER